jgi:hypothetical protein
MNKDWTRNHTDNCYGNGGCDPVVAVRKLCNKQAATAFAASKVRCDGLRSTSSSISSSSCTEPKEGDEHSK